MFIYSSAHITLGQYWLHERFISHVQYEVLPKYASGSSLTGCNFCNPSFETPVNFIKAKQTPAQRKMSAAAIAEKLEAALAVLPALNTRLDELTERQSRLEAEGRAQSSSSKAPLHTQLGLPTEAARGKDVPVKQIVSLVGPPPKRGTEVQRLSNDPEPPNVVQEAQEHLGPAEEGSMMQALMTQSAALTSLVSHLAQQSGGDPLLDLQASGASAGARGFQKGVLLHKGAAGSSPPDGPNSELRGRACRAQGEGPVNGQICGTLRRIRSGAKHCSDSA